MLVRKRVLFLRLLFLSINSSHIFLLGEQSGKPDLLISATGLCSCEHNRKVIFEQREVNRGDDAVCQWGNTEKRRCFWGCFSDWAVREQGCFRQIGLVFIHSVIGV